ncbi:MAG: nucleoside triphosphate pyrophosphohydrolase [Anaerolineae bacterium]|nr:nucleoside triphosphate pyrophosphohydrolase [Anaerolineae bacterium]
MTLTILGLGPGHPDDVTRRAWQALETASVVYLRTQEHPCVPALPVKSFTSFDDVYEASADFERIYDTICERLLAAAQTGDIVYAVPGDPMVAEATVQRLLKRAPEQGINVEIINGVSFVEPILRALEIDAIDGLQIYDALDIAAMHHPPINPDRPALLAQVYNRAVASDLKLTLMNQYPDEFEVVLVHGAGSDSAQTERLPLYAIDRSEHIHHLTALYIPALGHYSSFEAFQEIIAHLRAPEGCPWDREQTHLSLRRYLLEETHEVLEALDAEDMPALAEELGDLLLQIVLHAQIATEYDEFRMSDILSQVSQKMIRRHPHVWGDVNVDGAGQVVQNWEAIKQKEKGHPQRQSLLDGVPKDLPALFRALRLTEKAAKPGFDWASSDDVLEKLHEELDEVLTAADDQHREEEMGDLLFVVANWARKFGIDPEIALRAANAKFERRFRYVEAQAEAQGKPLKDFTLMQMDDWWRDAKVNGL